MDFFPISIQVLVELPLMMAITYIVSYRLIPSFITKPKLKHVLWALLLIGIAVLVRRWVMGSILYPWLYEGKDFTFVFYNIYRFAGYALDFIVVIGLFNAFKFYNEWRQEKSKARKLYVEKQAAQLRLLRAQVHPHFLFNMLNAIYYESIQKSDRAPELILKLSELLRFVLEECDKELIPLEKEIELIRNFAELELSRHGHRLQCDITVNAQETILIPPMLFFSLVENAFKYGVSDIGPASRIAVEILSNEESVSIQVSNSLYEHIDSRQAKTSLGLGLKNTIQQLDLLFDDNYNYSNDTSERTYTCYLQIPRQNL
jgi:sensor histidine kinase YesM